MIDLKSVMHNNKQILFKYEIINIDSKNKIFKNLIRLSAVKHSIKRQIIFTIKQQMV